MITSAPQIRDENKTSFIFSKKVRRKIISTKYSPIPCTILVLKSFTKNLKGAKYFSVLDLRSAYFNLPIHKDSIDKTTVLSPWGGAFAFRRMPFGLKNAPSSWQKFLDKCLSGISDIYTYLDDILISSKDEESHIATIHEIFKRLEENGLSLALNKCVFGKSEVDYLGFRVTSPSQQDWFLCTTTGQISGTMWSIMLKAVMGVNPQNRQKLKNHT